MWVPEDGTDPTLGVHERAEGDHARLHQIHVRDADAGTYRWDSLVFTPADSWFAATHDLIDAPAAAIVETLEERCPTVEIYDGYRDADGWPATVVVVRRD